MKTGTCPSCGQKKASAAKSDDLMMSDRVWNNHKQMLNKVLESKNSDVIAENSILVIPKLIDEIDNLRSRIDGTAGACEREREPVCV